MNQTEETIKNIIWNILQLEGKINISTNSDKREIKINIQLNQSDYIKS